MNRRHEVVRTSVVEQPCYPQHRSPQTQQQQPSNTDTTPTATPPRRVSEYLGPTVQAPRLCRDPPVVHENTTEGPRRSRVGVKRQRALAATIFHPRRTCRAWAHARAGKRKRGKEVVRTSVVEQPCTPNGKRTRTAGRPLRPALHFAIVLLLYVYLILFLVVTRKSVYRGSSGSSKRCVWAARGSAQGFDAMGMVQRTSRYSASESEIVGAGLGVQEKLGGGRNQPPPPPSLAYSAPCKTLPVAGFTVRIVSDGCKLGVLVRAARG